jgi:hypothetical protein
MPQKRLIQIGGSKETPLAVVGSRSSGLNGYPQREQIFTSKDAEYQYYNKLLSSFFDMLTRWQDIFGQYARPSYNSYDMFRSYYPSPYRVERELTFKFNTESNFDVLDAPKGLKRVPTLEFNAPEYPHKVLSAFMHSGHEETGSFKDATGIVMRFNQDIDHQEKQLLVDLNGVKPTSVEVKICDIPDRLAVKYLEVKAELSYDPSQTTDQNVRYELAQGRFIITRGYEDILDYNPMSDAYATHLLSNIHSLISYTPHTRQPERGVKQGTQLPKALPPARRRPGQ